MDRNRHQVIDLQTIPRPLAAFAARYRHGEKVAAHRHPRGQFLHSLTGALAIATPGRSWIIPPGRALWVPPDIEHGLTMLGDAAIHTIYVEAPHAAALPDKPQALLVTPLLRELIRRVLSFPPVYAEEGIASRIVELILEEIRSLPREELALPMPQDARLTAFAEAVFAAPAEAHDLNDWAAHLNMTFKTFSRRFHAETGMPPGSWRRQARLLAALRGLATGASVTAVALDCGYQTPSAFIDAFRRAFGATPGRYFSAGP